MATSTAPPPQQVQILTQKLYDADSDIRYMSLNDLATIFSGNHAQFLAQDITQCTKTVDGFLNTLNDPNGEVQNLTIKCLGPFVLKANPEVLSPLIYKIGTQTIDNTIDSSISAMALRTIVMSLPRPTPGMASTKAVQDAYLAIHDSLIPRLAGSNLPSTTNDGKGRNAPKSLLKDDLEKGTDNNAIDILIEVAKCFGPILETVEVKALEQTAMQLLESKKSGNVMKKKAVAAIAALAQYLSEQQLSSIVSYLIESLRASHLTASNRRLYISLMGSLADAIPVKFGRQLKMVAPFVLSALSQAELDDQMAESDGEEPKTEIDEVREAALTTLDVFLSSCPAAMERFNTESLEAILRFLKYDPNMAMGSDGGAEAGQDEDDEEFDADEDFEQDDAADDENDVSWKVRRCAARTLHSMLAVKGADLLDSSKSFETIAKGLLDRFKEREDAVRVEIVQTTTYMVRHCAQDDIGADADPKTAAQESQAAIPHPGNKRRRESDVSMSDHSNKRRLTGSISPPSESPVPPGAPANLAKIVPDVILGGLKLAAGTTLPTQVAAVTLLKEVIIARRGGASDHLQELFALIKSHLDSSPTSSALQTTTSTSLGSVQLEALRLLSEIAKATPSTSLQPSMSKAIPAVISTAKSKSPALACEALQTLEQLAKALTPPRSASTSKQAASQVSQILETVVGIASARSSDLETRKHAITVIAIVLGRTLNPQGAKLVTPKHRQTAFDLILECCKNETTRYATIKAIEVLGTQSPDDVSYDQTWFAEVVLELGNQLRKADRALRGASLGALRTLLADRKGSKNLSDPNQLTALLMPLLSSSDLHMIGPCLTIFAALIRDSHSNTVTPDFVKAFCALVTCDNAAHVVDGLSEVIECAGRRGTGKPIMHALLLDVGVNGSPAVVGRLIGDLLTSSDQNTLGINLDAFYRELKMAKDEPRVCLALSVIGQVGLQSGASASIAPEQFTAYFDKKDPQTPLAAAVALGRAAAGTGNPSKYLPVILARAKGNSRQQYLTVHSIKELLQHNQDPLALGPFKDRLWDAAVSASESEESKTVGAECIAVLTALDPKTRLPSLQVIQAPDSCGTLKLTSPDLQTMLAASFSSTRGTAIYALRDLLSTTADDSTYAQLKPIMVPVLVTMMGDAHPDNRKTALNTLGAAARHLPTLVLPSLAQLIPSVLDQTYEDPNLIREVSMGPFKHRVDDGLEARKSAYETIYSLLELSPSHLAPLVSTIYPRVVAGISGTGDHAIRALCNHVILRLASVMAPEDTVRILDDLAERFRSVLAVVLKDTAVRTEIEKTDEAKKASVKVAYQVQKRLAERGAKIGESGTGVTWTQFLEECRRDHGNVVKEVEKEIRDGA